MRYRLSHKKEYAGRVLDGPFEGDWIEEDEPYFQGTFTRRIGPVMAYSAELASAGMCVDRCCYLWLHGYRAWAWVQPLSWKER